ncbi:MAG TPA: aminomethyltransferase beta-barrel domain-containing protein, partial [Vicinamibacteria bacterium]
VEDVNWISLAPEGAIHCRVKIRSRHREAVARLVPRGPRSVHVEFEEPQTAVTPGQAAVFYQDEAVLGGGWITRD